jgi:hypothetical protein
LTGTGDVRWRRLLKIGAVLTGALTILWGFYFFRYAETRTGQDSFNRSLADKIRDVNTPFYHSVLVGMNATRIVPRSYLWGFADTVHAGMEGRLAPQLVFGHMYARKGPKYFFPAMIGVKLPIGLSALSLLGLIFFFARRLPAEWDFPAGVILAAALLFLLVLSQGATYAGIRHAMPVVALLAISTPPARWSQSRKTKTEVLPRCVKFSREVGLLTRLALGTHLCVGSGSSSQIGGLQSALEGRPVATNRRDALKGGVTLLGAALGIGAASKSGLAATPDRAEESKQSVPLVLHGQRWRITSQDLRRGELPRAGIRMLARGEIMDKPSHGRKIGDFFATYHRLNTPGKVAHHEPGSLELHTFVFPDGTIVGSGVATAATDSEGQFAIIGGTGRYQGVRGSYVARQSYSDFGGDGTATLTLTLI